MVQKTFFPKVEAVNSLQVTSLFFVMLEFSLSWSSLARQRYFRCMIGFTVLGDSMNTFYDAPE